MAAAAARLLALRLPPPEPPRGARLADRTSPPVCRFLRRFAPDPSKPSAIRKVFESLSAPWAERSRSRHSPKRLAHLIGRPHGLRDARFDRGKQPVVLIGKPNVLVDRPAERCRET